MKPRLEGPIPSKKGKSLGVKKKISTSKPTISKALKKKSAGPLKQEVNEEDALALTMSVEDFRMWSLEALQCFLRLRKKSTTGTFDALSARAFTAWEEKVPVDSEEEHMLRMNLKDYKDKLIIGADTLPDPFTLEKGWFDETDKAAWPQLYFHDIATYFQTKTSSNLFHRLCNEYKEGKGYRYFTDGHVKEVYYHPNTANINVAFFAAHVKPSMRSIPDYQVWVAVEKKTAVKSGGRVYSAYCTCTSGLHGSCNHIAGVLFRVEYAVRCGLTKPTCTSLPCVWTAPSQKYLKNQPPRPLADIVWKKEQYTNADHGEHQQSVRQLATEFSTMSKQQEVYVSNGNQVRSDLAALLHKDVPHSCFAQSFYGTPFVEEPEPVCPATPVEIAKGIEQSESDMNECIMGLETAMKLGAKERDNLQKGTVLQGQSTGWLAQREGRITASNIKAVVTRTTTILDPNKDDSQKDPTCLTKKLMGYTKVPEHLSSIKHGRAMEPHAKRCYTKLMRKHHKHFHTKDSGLHIHPELPYLGASPDLMVSCKCCGEGLCEIKAPESIKEKDPKTADYDHLTHVEGVLKLSKKSQYYYQVQAQMGILGLPYCDIFIYTAHGHYLDRIEFDPEHWDSVVKLCSHFWHTFVAPELLTGKILLAHGELEEKHLQDHTYARKVEAMEVDLVSDPVFNPLTRPVLPQVLFCGLCKCDISVGTSKGNLQCQMCHRWFHMLCLEIAQEESRALQCDWLCDVCIMLWLS